MRRNTGRFDIGRCDALTPRNRLPAAAPDCRRSEGEATCPSAVPCLALDLVAGRARWSISQAGQDWRPLHGMALRGLAAAHLGGAMMPPRKAKAARVGPAASVKRHN